MSLPKPLASLIAVLLIVTSFPSRAAQAAVPTPQASGLKIVVIAGEDAQNVIQQKTAIAPVVEVRDRNDLPVAGASVVFAVAAGRATLNNGVQQVAVVTDATGRATVSINPLARGAADVQVRATWQGQTATTTIRQTNVASAQEAAQTKPAAEAASTGLSAGVIAAIVGGGVAGTALAVKAGGGTSNSTNQAPVIGGVTATPSAVITGTNTPIAFTAQATDADNNPLTFTWDFGDGTTGSGATASHVYASAGAFTVTLTVNDGKTSATSQTAVSVKPFAGTWTLPGTLSLTFNVSGSTFTGTGVYTSLTGLGVQPGTITNGTLRGSSPRIGFTFTFTQNAGGGCIFTWSEVYSGDPASDANLIQFNVNQTITPNSGVCGIGVRTTSFQTFIMRP